MFLFNLSYSDSTHQSWSWITANYFRYSDIKICELENCHNPLWWYIRWVYKLWSIPIFGLKFLFILDRDTISRVANALTVESSTTSISISLLKLNSSRDLYERRENIKRSLMSFPHRFVGKWFNWKWKIF